MKRLTSERSKATELMLEALGISLAVLLSSAGTAALAVGSRCVFGVIHPAVIDLDFVQKLEKL